MTATPAGVTWLTRRAADVPDDDDWLTDAERRTLAGLHVPKRRADWRLGRFTVKEAVRARLGPDAPRHPAIGIRPAADGAPELLLDGEPGPLAVSITHRASHAVVALAEPGRAIGCDLELIEPRLQVFLEDFFTAAEMGAVERAAGPTDVWRRAELVTRLWAAKEAALKALREGLRIDTRRIEVQPPVPGEPPDGATGAWETLTVVAHIATERDLPGWATRLDDKVLVVVTDRHCAQPVEMR